MNKHQKIINKIAKAEIVKHKEMFGDEYNFRESRIGVREALGTRSFRWKKHYYKYWFGTKKI